MKFLLNYGIATPLDNHLDPEEAGESDPRNTYEISDSDPLVINLHSARMITKVAEDAMRRAYEAIDQELLLRKHERGQA